MHTGNQKKIKSIRWSIGLFGYWRKHDKVLKEYYTITYVSRGLTQKVKSRISIPKSLF